MPTLTTKNLEQPEKNIETFANVVDMISVVVHTYSFTVTANLQIQMWEMFPKGSYVLRYSSSSV